VRERDYLRQRYAAITSAVGFILLLSSFVMLTPLLILVSNPEEAVHGWDFGLPAALLLLLGMTLWQVFRPASKVALTVQEGGIIVLLSWTVVMLFSAWPLASAAGLPYSRAVFESVSGWTTTGLSVIDVRNASRIILLWRSIIQLAGGAGLAIIVMSAIVGPVGVGIASAEGRSDQLVPHVRRSARLVLAIYLTYAAVGTLAYRLAGMSSFDAVNHAFTAVSTGGFSTRAESIGFWDSTAVEIVTLALMLLGNLSFVTAWFLWRGKLRTVARNGEVRLVAVLIPLSVAALFLLTTREVYPRLGKPLRVACFEAVTAVTTTGFSSVGYGNWNAFGLFLLVVLMLIGGGTCSTAGGIKQFRVYLSFRMVAWEVRRCLLPRPAVQERPLWEGEKRTFVDDSRARQVMVFMFTYLVSYGIGVAILCACGFGLADSLFEFASALGTVGLSVGVTSAMMPDVALWSETIAMFLGRLEIMVVIVSLLRITRDFRLLFARPPHGA
jgi:trk system potassium uptake protein TrkH